MQVAVELSNELGKLLLELLNIQMVEQEAVKKMPNLDTWMPFF